jgi:integrase
VRVQAEAHEEAAVNAALRTVLESGRNRAAPAPTEITAPPSITQKTGNELTAPYLSEVIDDFLIHYKKNKKTSMLKKHQAVLSMMLEVIGDKPVTQLRQVDIRDFFALLANLPPRWKDKCRQLNMSIRDLAELDHEETLGPKSFEDTYLASIRPFLKAARINYQDQGFPHNLTVDGIEYIGDRVEGENKQRAFTTAELKRLFEGQEMQRFAADPIQAHCFWLPHLGLFTGARVNEICQLNPQTDIIQDKEHGVWHLWITTETEADPRIRKSVKTGDARMVPIHQKLIELGFLDYVKCIKETGAKLLFPQWQPVNKRASGEAEDWFRQLLRDTNLRDETPKLCLLGMHAFRHTLLTYGALQKPPLSLFCITGHAQEEAPIHATGAGKGYLTLSLLSPINNRSELLNQLDYPLNFIQPKRFSCS